MIMRMLSRSWATVALMAFTQIAIAQQWPTKPIRLIVPFPPGGTSDIAARVASERLTARLGQPVVVDNRPGVAGILGTEATAKAPADGYTLVLTSIAPIAFAPSTPKKLPYDAVGDLTHIGLFGTIPLVMIVNNDLPVKSVQELVTLAKQKPGALNFSSSGNATPSHFMLERFKLTAHVDITHVPFKGSAAALTDIMAKRIDGTIDSLPPLLGQLRAGTVRPIAVSGRERIPQFPDVPTFAQAGYPDLVVNTWFGLAVPAATPRDIAQRLNQELNDLWKIPEVRTKFEELSFAPAILSLEETQRFVRDEIERWRPVVQASGISFQ
jgi:tripartite-type tricarboxylate transporter receptor subunit TctC